MDMLATPPVCETNQDGGYFSEIQRAVCARVTDVSNTKRLRKFRRTVNVHSPKAMPYFCFTDRFHACVDERTKAPTRVPACDRH
jgi:hypothetical protein